ncbi:MAG: asparagine synthase (glutamine-hydrolyzing), partial [Thermoanaerobaculia bacterium]
MCGIAGWIAPAGEAADVEALRALARAIAHRGPDDRGEFLSPDGGVGLAHLRLSIIDLSAASHQPMVERERGLVLVYNGELYNFRELRTELEGLGQRFATSGDTEVVLRAFAAWGEGCFARFAGMFALAIWDERAERLWLARDATGMKPLYFHERRGGGVLFASEVKAFLELPGFSPEANRASLSQFLEFGYVFDGDATMLQGVRKVLPGEVIEVGRSGIRRRFRHFEPPPVERDDRRSGDDRAAELHDTLGRVVREHLIADVPVGLLLSGGIDSSLVAAYAARDARLTTVTMAFADSAVDEREPARRVAQFLGTDHHEVEIRPQEIADEIVDDAWIFDDLFADWGTVSTRILYRKFRGLGFKVALVGEGSDELFGGYPIFEQTEPEKGSGLFRQFRLYQRYAGQRFGSQFGAFRRILREYRRAVGGGLFEAIRRFEAERQLPNNYVMKVDKASMSVSLEARAPFLDRRIAGIAYRTPREWLLRDGENKWLLREVARRNGLLPPEISSRAKFGASIAASWIEQVPSFRDLARDVVLDRGGWVDELGLRPQMERFFAGESGDPWPRRDSVDNHHARRLLLLYLW